MGLRPFFCWVLICLWLIKPPYILAQHTQWLTSGSLLIPHHMCPNIIYNFLFQSGFGGISQVTPSGQDNMTPRITPVLAAGEGPAKWKLSDRPEMSMFFTCETLAHNSLASCPAPPMRSTFLETLYQPFTTQGIIRVKHWHFLNGPLDL